MAQGEVTQAPARWFAELFVTDPDEDTVAAYAHALLSAKTRFRFAPPVFEIYSEEDAARRDAEHEAQKRREAILAEGVPRARALERGAAQAPRAAGRDARLSRTGGGGAP